MLSFRGVLGKEEVLYKRSFALQGVLHLYQPRLRQELSNSNLMHVRAG